MPGMELMGLQGVSIGELPLAGLAFDLVAGAVLPLPGPDLDPPGVAGEIGFEVVVASLLVLVDLPGDVDYQDPVLDRVYRQPLPPLA